MRILICLLFSIAAVDFATAGCDIALGVKNETGKEVRFDMNDFKVRTGNVPEVEVYKKSWDLANFTSLFPRNENCSICTAFLPAGEVAMDIYEATLGCNRKRRYSLKFTCEGITDANDGLSMKFLDFPGPKKWTTSTNVVIPIKSCK